MSYQVKTPDGRRLSTQIYGDPDGKPVFLLHGTPGSRLGPHPRAAVLHRLGVRLIAFDRPGYGESDRFEGRRVADAATDIQAVADAYGLDRFAVVGRSGGGPHALACAALLPDRVSKAAVLEGLAPRKADGLDWYDGAVLSDVREYAAAADGYGRFATLTEAAADAVRSDPASLLRSLQAEMPDPDRRVVADRGIRAMLLETYAEAVRKSAYGWLDDALAFCTSWGFDPDEVRIPILLWHGANDSLSPVSGARSLADRLPSATVVVQPGAAHFSALDVLPDILRWLSVDDPTGHTSASGSRIPESDSPAERIVVADRQPPFVALDRDSETPSADPPDKSLVGHAVPLPRRRYLKGECPETIPVDRPFSLLASIVLAGMGRTGLKLFDVPPHGRDVLLVLHAPGLRLLGDQRQNVHVPADGNSERVMFELLADAPGPRQASITAWAGGNYLGELIIEITAERGHPAGPHRDVLTEITTDTIEGAVSLVVRHDPAQNSYRFEFRDEDNPSEVTSKLAYEPGPRVEQILSGLDDLAKGRSGYSGDQVRDYLVNAGAGLWRELVPQALREQFWDRQRRIQQLTILADKDAVPWELLYPRDPGHDADFLVKQFPVTRAIFGHRQARTMSLWPARFVLPEGSPPEAQAEIDAIRGLLDPAQASDAVISALTPLQHLIRGGNFGLLHFACHNRFSHADGSSITLDNVQFTPTLLTTAAIDRVLNQSTPIIFMNACRSAGLNATYNRLDGWASKFLEAGAGAFIGSQWAVCDGTASEFAQEFYNQLRAGSSLGKASKHARQVAASQTNDPTWLAYTVYGDARATAR